MSTVEWKSEEIFTPFFTSYKLKVRKYGSTGDPVSVFKRNSTESSRIAKYVGAGASLGFGECLLRDFNENSSGVWST